MWIPQEVAVARKRPSDPGLVGGGYTAIDCRVAGGAGGSLRQHQKVIDCRLAGGAGGYVQQQHQKWINRQITYAAESGNVGSLLEVVAANLEGMNLINISTALHRISKLALGCSLQYRDALVQQEGVQQLHRVTVGYVCENVRVLGSRDPFTGQQQQSEMRCVSIICWSCASLRLRDERLFEHVAAVSCERVSEMKSFELSNLLWAFAKLSFAQSIIFDRLPQHMMSRGPGEFSPQCLSTIVWAFGTASVHHAAMFSSIAEELSDNAAAMAPQGIANTTWAFACVRRQEPSLFCMLADAAIRDSVAWSFKPQELSNTAWAFATVRLTHPPLFEKFVDVAMARRQELLPQNIANIMWAYAKLAVPARTRLFPSLLEVAAGHLSKFKPQEVSAILWAVSREAWCSPVCIEIFEAVPRHFGWRLHEFSPQALACLVEAYALAEVDDCIFFDEVLKESVGRLSRFQPPTLCTLFRGVALKVRRDPSGSSGEYIEAISGHIFSRLAEMQQHNVTYLRQTLDLLPTSSLSVGVRRLLSTMAVFATKEEAVTGPSSLENTDFVDLDSGLLSIDDSYDLGCGDRGRYEGRVVDLHARSSEKFSPTWREISHGHSDEQHRLPYSELQHPTIRGRSSEQHMPAYSEPHHSKPFCPNAAARLWEEPQQRETSHGHSDERHRLPYSEMQHPTIRGRSNDRRVPAYSELHHSKPFCPSAAARLWEEPQAAANPVAFERTGVIDPGGLLLRAGGSQSACHGRSEGALVGLDWRGGGSALRQTIPEHSNEQHRLPYVDPQQAATHGRGDDWQVSPFYESQHLGPVSPGTAASGVHELPHRLQHQALHVGAAASGGHGSSYYVPPRRAPPRDQNAERLGEGIFSTSSRVYQL